MKVEKGQKYTDAMEEMPALFTEDESKAPTV
jgi:hypothetical protein